jgi:multidrug efflux pump subunit AcrB
MTANIENLPLAAEPSAHQGPVMGVGSGVLLGVASNALKAWDELTDTTHPRAFQRMKEAMEKLRDAVEEHEADEVGRVVDAMTPEQVDAYLVSMGVNMDEMRAHTAEMRKKLEARLSSANTAPAKPSK